jgi:hypothetical protein
MPDHYAEVTPRFGASLFYLAFTEDGIENLTQIIANLRADGRAPPRKPSAE